MDDSGFSRISKLKAFHDAVQREFGKNLEKATPANVREFLDRYQLNTLSVESPVRFELNEPKTTYEEILKDFFLRVLEKPTDEAMIQLWTLAFEMSFSALEQNISPRFEQLFGELGKDL